MMTFMSWTDSSRLCPDRAGTAGLAALRHRLQPACWCRARACIILLDALAAVAPEIPQAQLWIIGRHANAEYAAELQAQVERLGLSERVTFVEHIPQAELARYMARARVFVLPTYSEGMPKVVVEAMLCGTPVIASAVDGIPEILQDGVQGYLVPPGDVDALAQKLRRIFGDAPVDQMGQQARAFATEFYSPDAYIQNYGRLFTLAYDQAQQQ